MDSEKDFEIKLREDLLRFRQVRDEWSRRLMYSTGTDKNLEADRKMLSGFALDLVARLDSIGGLGTAVLVTPTIACTAWPRTVEDSPENFLEFYEWMPLSGYDQPAPSAEPVTNPAQLQSL